MHLKVGNTSANNTEDKHVQGVCEVHYCASLFRAGSHVQLISVISSVSVSPHVDHIT